MKKIFKVMILILLILSFSSCSTTRNWDDLSSDEKAGCIIMSSIGFLMGGVLTYGLLNSTSGEGFNLDDFEEKE